MFNCSITGFGWISADSFGCGTGSSFNGFSAGELPQLTRKDIFPKPDRAFGRLDKFSRLGLGGIAFALRDAGLEQWQQKRPIAIYADSNSGCYATDRQYFASVIDGNGEFASPQLFAYTLPNTFLGEAALRFGLTGNCQICNHNGSDSLLILRTAIDDIAMGDHEQVIAGYCDYDGNGSIGKAGALFMVIQQQSDGGDGMVIMQEDDGSLLFNGHTLDTVTQLINYLQQS